MNEASDNDWTRTMASVNDAFAKDPAASINVMFRTMAFTARQTGRSFLVRHEDQVRNVVWLYHLGGEADVRITRKESLPGEWLGAEPRAASWPTTGEQFERLQAEADEHIEALGREEMVRQGLARAKAEELGFPSDFFAYMSVEDLKNLTIQEVERALGVNEVEATP